MNMIRDRNESFGAVVAKGPPPANAPQTAKHDRMRAMVAVSRWSPRRAAHNSGSAARKANALRYPLCAMSGLNAARPTAIAAPYTMADANRSPGLKVRESASTQKTTTGAKTKTPAASRSHHPTHRASKLVPSPYPASHKLPTPTVAPTIALGPRTTKANFATPLGVSKVRKPSDQMSIT